MQMIVGCTIQQGPPNVHSADKGPEGVYLSDQALYRQRHKRKNVVAGLSS
jgi:hypothetical protein